MAVIALCLKSPKDKVMVARMALTSAFTCIGGRSTDQVRNRRLKLNFTVPAVPQANTFIVVFLLLCYTSNFRYWVLGVFTVMLSGLFFMSC